MRRFTQDKSSIYTHIQSVSPSGKTSIEFSSMKTRREYKKKDCAKSGPDNEKTRWAVDGFSMLYVAVYASLCVLWIKHIIIVSFNHFIGHSFSDVLCRFVCLAMRASFCLCFVGLGSAVPSIRGRTPNGMVTETPSSAKHRPPSRSTREKNVYVEVVCHIPFDSNKNISQHRIHSIPSAM